MATITKLTSSNAFYGYDNYTNSAATHMYIGAANSSTKYDYRSRLTFQPITSVAAIGSSRIRITKILLHIRRNDGGPTAITVGCSTGSAWGAKLDASASGTVKASTGWYQIDLTALADAVAGYKSNWYLHLMDGTPRLRCDGTGKSTKPYLEVTWEYIAATITGDRDSAELGTDAVTFTIAPEVSGETHTLTYALGDATGTIAAKAGNSITWTPPLALAAEITDDDSAAAEIRMTVYNPDGSVQRTELYYQTVTVPASVAPTIADVGAALVSGLEGYGLSGRSRLDIAPEIDMNGAYGATLTGVTAAVAGQTVQWTSLSEGEPGVFIGAAARTNVLTVTGTVAVILTATDSRGRSVTARQSFEFCAYAPPTIAAFSVERYEPVYDADEQISGYVASDLGDAVWVSLAAGVTSVAPAGAELNRIGWTIEATNAETGETVTRSGTGAQSVLLTADRTVFPSAVSGDEAWTYTLTVTDTAGGKALQYSAVATAHAAVSVSPDKRGFAVGMIATGTKVRPRFEVAEGYESRFYGPAYDRHGAELLGGALVLDEYDSNAIAVPSSTNVEIHLFTAEIGGLHAVSFTGGWSGSGDGVHTVALLRPDGSYAAASRIHSGGAKVVQQNVSALIPLAAGEAVTALVWQNSGTAESLSFHICQIARIGG